MKVYILCYHDVFNDDTGIESVHDSLDKANKEMEKETILAEELGTKVIFRIEEWSMQ